MQLLSETSSMFEQLLLDLYHKPVSGQWLQSKPQMFSFRALLHRIGLYRT